MNRVVYSMQSLRLAVMLPLLSLQAVERFLYYLVFNLHFILRVELRFVNS